VAGLIAAMFKDGIKGEVINIGNPGEFTMMEAAQLIKKITGTKSKIVHKPLPKDDPARRKPDISKAKKILGWQPTVKFEEGLPGTIKWFRDGI
jgi:nucleoside-diphosphate-sugar epimerase